MVIEMQRELKGRRRTNDEGRRKTDSSTVLRLSSAFRYARARLAALDDADITATALVGHVLGLTRAQVLARPETLLTPDEAAAFEGLVARAASGEPLAYLTGHREFCGLEFEVDARVLVPRPETELLVDRALAVRPARVLDVGTGSGCIAVALAVRLPQAVITASDLSAGALEVARRNAQRHGVAAQIEFVQSDLLDFIQPPTSQFPDFAKQDRPTSHFRPPTSDSAPPHPFHLIAANLPYIDPDELRTLAVSRFEPRLALDGGPGGLALVERLLSQAPSALAPGGLVLLEIGGGQGQAALRLARAAFPDASARIERDLAGLDRLLVIETP
jgi:release factor glutamine methyltransferase